MNDEQLTKMHELAADVLRLSRNTLLVNLRFMDAALSRLEGVETEDITFATDGRYLAYDPRHVLRCYKQEKEVPVRDYLHIVLHCVFRHMFVDPAVLHPCWDLACDMAAEFSIASLGLKAATARREQQQRMLLQKLQSEIGPLTAEKIYRYYLENGITEPEMVDLRGLFYADDHRIWYTTDEEKEALGIPRPVPDGGRSGEGDGDGDR